MQPEKPQVHIELTRVGHQHLLGLPRPGDASSNRAIVTWFTSIANASTQGPCPVAPVTAVKKKKCKKHKKKHKSAAAAKKKHCKKKH